mmetsp:Transcript_33323/g.93527  ORF Transcript_33323/g.93527 Transcript_33323/m.93527 type:complete len:214 (-) Transcript_33323:72-713(-)
MLSGLHRMCCWLPSSTSSHRPLLSSRLAIFAALPLRSALLLRPLISTRAPTRSPPSVFPPISSRSSPAAAGLGASLGASSSSFFFLGAGGPLTFTLSWVPSGSIVLFSDWIASFIAFSPASPGTKLTKPMPVQSPASLIIAFTPLVGMAPNVAKISYMSLSAVSGGRPQMNSAFSSLDHSPPGSTPAWLRPRFTVLMFMPQALPPPLELPFAP